jgi:hypothetical protein
MCDAPSKQSTMVRERRGIVGEAAEREGEGSDILAADRVRVYVSIGLRCRMGRASQVKQLDGTEAIAPGASWTRQNGGEATAR